MLREKMTVTISFPVELNVLRDLDISMADLGKDLEKDCYSDGRYPFYREMLGLALSKLLDSSLFVQVQNHMTSLYGNEIVVTETENSRSETSRAYLETLNWLDNNKPNIFVEQDDWIVHTEDR